jgi:hypothetical protein
MENHSSTTASWNTLTSALLGVVAGVALFVLVVPEGSVERISHVLFGKAGISRGHSKSDAKGKVALRARPEPGTEPRGDERGLSTTSTQEQKGLGELSVEEVAAGGDPSAFFVTAQKLGSFFSDVQTSVFPSLRPATNASWGVRAALTSGSRLELEKGESPVVITRGQFLDVVTRNMPTSLPTSTARDGVVFHSLAETEISTKVLSAALDEEELAHDALCSPKRRLDASKFKRVTLIFHATRANLDCAKVFLAREIRAPQEGSKNHSVREITLVALSGLEGYYGAREEGGVTLTMQTWESRWLDSMVAAWDDEASLSVTSRRAKRLAQTTRALGRASDVVVDIPVLKGAVTPFGNFVALPRSLAIGTVRARRIGDAVKKSKGKEAAWTLTPTTSLLIVSGVGKGLKFEAVERR